MAKAKKRVAARKKSFSKSGKANAKPSGKMAAKHATPKKAKSKVQRAGMSAKKPSAKKKRPPETVAAKPIETTIIDAIKEPAPGVVAVTEYETVHTASSLSTGAESERGEGIAPVSTST